MLTQEEIQGRIQFYENRRLENAQMVANLVYSGATNKEQIDDAMQATYESQWMLRAYRDVLSRDPFVELLMKERSDFQNVGI